MTPTRRYLLQDLLGNREKLLELAGMLDAGGIGIYPTETIYGIGGRGDRESARQRILEAKRRPPENPMILIAAARSAFSGMDLVFTNEAESLARRFWPGNLTLVLPVATGGTLGIRVSAHPFIQTLGTVADYPLFSTSANVSGEKYDGSPSKMWEQFNGTADFFVDAGDLPVSPPSTVVSVDGNGNVKVLREGVIAAVEIVG